jgi:hypothetical protein
MLKIEKSGSRRKKDLKNLLPAALMTLTLALGFLAFRLGQTLQKQPVHATQTARTGAVVLKSSGFWS